MACDFEFGAFKNCAPKSGFGGLQRLIAFNYYDFKKTNYVLTTGMTDYEMTTLTNDIIGGLIGYEIELRENSLEYDEALQTDAETGALFYNGTLTGTNHYLSEVGSIISHKLNTQKFVFAMQLNDGRWLIAGYQKGFESVEGSGVKTGRQKNGLTGYEFNLLTECTEPARFIAEGELLDNGSLTIETN